MCNCLQGADSELERCFCGGAFREDLGRQQIDCLLKKRIEVAELCDDYPCNGWKHAYEVRLGFLDVPDGSRRGFRVPSLSLGSSAMRLLKSSMSFETSVTPNVCLTTYSIVRHRPCAACSWSLCLAVLPQWQRGGNDATRREMSNYDHALDNLANR